MKYIYFFIVESFVHGVCFINKTKTNLQKYFLPSFMQCRDPKKGAVKGSNLKKTTGLFAPLGIITLC